MDLHPNTEYGVGLQIETGTFGAIAESLAVASPHRLTAPMALTPISEEVIVNDLRIHRSGGRTPNRSKTVCIKQNLNTLAFLPAFWIN
jgi:hypothetical protein